MRFSKLDDRVKAVGLAYATTGLSKIATAAVQIIALPIAAYSVEVQGFGALMTMAGVASLLSLPGQGIGPATSYNVATAIGSGRIASTGEGFWSASILAFIGASISAILGLAAYLALPITFWSFEQVGSLGIEIRTTLLLVTAQVSLIYLAGLTEGARAAFAQNHITNLFALTASCAVLAACVWGGRTAQGLPFFYFAIFVVPPLVQCLNLLGLLWEHRLVLGTPRVSRSAAWQVFSHTRKYMLAQAGFSLHLQGVVVFSGTVLGLQAGAIAGAVSRASILLQSSIVSLANPIFPIIAKAKGAGNDEEAYRVMIYLLAATALMAAAVGVISALFGDRIFSLWLGIKLPPLSLTMAAAGALFFAYSTTHVGYLAALAGGYSESMAQKYFLGGVAAILIDFLFVSGESVTYPLAVSAVFLWAINGVVLVRNLIAQAPTSESVS